MRAKTRHFVVVIVIFRLLLSFLGALEARDLIKYCFFLITHHFSSIIINLNVIDVDVLYFIIMIGTESTWTTFINKSADILFLSVSLVVVIEFVYSGCQIITIIVIRSRLKYSDFNVYLNVCVCVCVCMAYAVLTNWV